MSAHDAIRSRLDARLSELLHRDAALQRHLRGKDGRLDADFSDRVAFTEMDEVLEQLDDAARAEIEQIRATMQRIEDGSFGVCVTCGVDIKPARLDIMPHAHQCVDCAEAAAA